MEEKPEKIKEFYGEPGLVNGVDYKQIEVGINKIYVAISSKGEKSFIRNTQHLKEVLKIPAPQEELLPLI